MCENAYQAEHRGARAAKLAAGMWASGGSDPTRADWFDLADQLGLTPPSATTIAMARGILRQLPARCEVEG